MGTFTKTQTVLDNQYSYVNEAVAISGNYFVDAATNTFKSVSGSVFIMGISCWVVAVCAAAENPASAAHAAATMLANVRRFMIFSCYFMVSRMMAITSSVLSVL